MTLDPRVNPQTTSHRLAHSARDVTRITGVGRSFIYEEIKEGRVRIRKAGRRSLIFDADLKTWLASLLKSAAPKFSSTSQKEKPGLRYERRTGHSKALANESLQQRQ
jgi:excisionase family DNA binding protein